MSDIVERLRKKARANGGPDAPARNRAIAFLCTDAADEIERLRGTGDTESGETIEVWTDPQDVEDFKGRFRSRLTVFHDEFKQIGDMSVTLLTRPTEEE